MHMLCFSGILDNKQLVSQFRITAHLSVILTGINCSYSRKSRANSYRICLSNYIEIAIFLASVFVMTYLFPLMLGCHLESNHTLNIAYFKLQKTNFSIALSTFVVYIKIVFCMKIHGNSIQKKTVCPWKAFFLFFPFLFTLSRILSPFLLLE